MIFVTDDNVYCDTKCDTFSRLRPNSDDISSFDVPVSSFAQTAVCLFSFFNIQSDRYLGDVAASVARAKTIPV